MQKTNTDFLSKLIICTVSDITRDTSYLEEFEENCAFLQTLKGKKIKTIVEIQP